jgi:hypothetical protein
MLNSRRDFLKGVALANVSLCSPRLAAASERTRWEGICRLNIFANQLGYLPGGTKKFVVESNYDALKPLFHIRETECFGEDHRVYQGKLEEVNADPAGISWAIFPTSGSPASMSLTSTR